jgi:hypothetical protein
VDAKAEKDSRLAEFGKSAFAGCSALILICIPAQVEPFPMTVLLAVVHWLK